MTTLLEWTRNNPRMFAALAILLFPITLTLAMAYVIADIAKETINQFNK